MSRFYAEIQGNRGQATRGGSGKSGISGHIRGWNVGIRVWGHINSKGQDEFVVYLTSGSNGSRAERMIGCYTEKDPDK